MLIHAVAHHGIQRVHGNAHVAQLGMLHDEAPLPAAGEGNAQIVQTQRRYGNAAQHQQNFLPHGQPVQQLGKLRAAQRQADAKQRQEADQKQQHTRGENEKAAQGYQHPVPELVSHGKNLLSHPHGVRFVKTAKSNAGLGRYCFAVVCQASSGSFSSFTSIGSGSGVLWDSAGVGSPSNSTWPAGFCAATSATLE